MAGEYLTPAERLREQLEAIAELNAERRAGDSLDAGPADTPGKPWAHTAAYSLGERDYERSIYGD